MGRHRLKTGNCKFCSSLNRNPEILGDQDAVSFVNVLKVLVTKQQSYSGIISFIWTSLLPLHGFFNMKMMCKLYLFSLSQFRDQNDYLYFILLRLKKNKMVGNIIFVSQKINYWNDFPLGARFMNGVL